MSKPIKLSLLPLILFAAACGRDLRPPVREDPLGACEQLTRPTCGQRADCTVEPLACDAACRDDGFGGCLPCDAFRCIPTPVVVACEALSVAQCGSRSDCRLDSVACLAICQPDGNGGCAPCPQSQRCVTIPPASCSSLDIATCSTRPDCRVENSASDEGFAPCAPDNDGCRRPQRCVDVPPPSCEQLDLTQCGQRDDCHVEDALCDCVNCGCDVPRCVSGPRPCSSLDVNTCSTRRDCRVVFGGGGFTEPADCDEEDGCFRPDSGSGSPPPPMAYCVDAGPIACWELDINSCISRPDCELREVTACPACAPGQTCPPCETTLLCDVRTTPDTCTGLDPTVCELNPGCVLEDLTACPACDPAGGAPCPPCTSQQICVARPPVDSCTGLDIVACSARTDCQVEEVGVCPACAPGSTCPPCTTTFVCVARPEDKCSLLDIATCRLTPECAVESVGVCPACAPGGNCPPCTTTEVCVPAPSRCFGLDELSCNADPACRYEIWACPAICIDDGMGGCLPCNAPASECVPVGSPTDPEPYDGGVAPPRNP